MQVAEWLGACQPISAMSHLSGAFVALLAAVPLLRQARGSRSRFGAIAVYVTTVIATLAISGSYHWLARGCAARDLMQRLDHDAIFLLIAGTFTAVHGVLFVGPWRSRVLIFIWSCAVVGMFLQFFFLETFSGAPGLALYLGVGWVGALSIYKVGKRLGFRAARYIWLAGLVYSVGAIFEATGHPTLIARWIGPHEIFHAAVIVGVALHWAFIRRVLIEHMPIPLAPVPAVAVGA